MCRCRLCMVGCCIRMSLLICVLLFCSMLRFMKVDGIVSRVTLSSRVLVCLVILCGCC